MLKIKSQKELKMNIEIYYFSGTGNSLAVAREISEIFF